MSTAGHLINSSLASSTRDNYKKVLEDLQAFAINHGWSGSLPANPGVIILFITDLFLKGLAATTLFSRISALSYMHKINDVHDTTQHFLVQKLLLGIKKVKPSADIRPPMTVLLLEQFLKALSTHLYPVYKTYLFKCMLVLGFFGFLRPGEMTESCHNIPFEQVVITQKQVEITFKTFKHYHGRPITICIKSQQNSLCPVACALKYLEIRGSTPGPFFCMSNGDPVKYCELLDLFKLLNSCVSSSKLSPHSLRIGAATHAAIIGLSQDEIQRLGLWHSSAHLKYIRISSFDVKL